MKKEPITKKELKTEFKKEIRKEFKEFKKDLVTKKELKQELKEFKKDLVTKKELKTELKKFATKKDLSTEIDKLAEATSKGFEEQTSWINKKFKEQFNQFSQLLASELGKQSRRLDQILSSNDHVAKEIITMRQEQAMIIGGRVRVDNTLLNHEKRIKKLEKIPMHA